jgi:carbon storage regulator
MLVLSRKKGEEVVLDKDIIVKIIQINGCRVRLGIDAPLTKKILRRELAETVIAAEPTTHFSSGRGFSGSGQ